MKRHKVQYGLFDLDNTLYPRDAGVMEAVSQRINAYMASRLGMDEATIKELRPRYWKQYGTTMRGLLVEFHIDPDDYLWYVHDFPVAELLAPNAELNRVLASLPWRKVIFTNASRAHTQQVLAALGIEQHFERIFDIKDTGYIGKPHPSAYLFVLNALGAAPGDCLIIDDSIVNLRPARELGMVTVLVGFGDVAAPPPAKQDASSRPDEADFVIHRIEEISRIV